MTFREMARLSDVAAAEIEALQAEGYTLTPAEVIRINALGQVIENPASRMALARGVPVPVGGAVLWPLTLAGADWYKRHSASVRSQRASLEMLAYAMAHGDSDMPESKPDRAVADWVRNLRARREELVEAVDQVLMQEEEYPPSKDQLPEGFGDLSARLAAVTGSPPEIWERKCSIAYCAGVLRAIVVQNDAQGQPVGSDVRMRAEKLMGLTIAKIRKRGKHGA